MCTAGGPSARPDCPAQRPPGSAPRPHSRTGRAAAGPTSVGDSGMGINGSLSPHKEPHTRPEPPQLLSRPPWRQGPGDSPSVGKPNIPAESPNAGKTQMRGLGTAGPKRGPGGRGIMGSALNKQFASLKGHDRCPGGCKLLIVGPDQHSTTASNENPSMVAYLFYPLESSRTSARFP